MQFLRHEESSDAGGGARFSVSFPEGRSVAAILHTDDGAYLLQHRDERPNVELGGYWGLFGGALEHEESLEHAMRRELEEELEFCPRNLRYFTTIITDLQQLSRRRVCKHVFTAEVTRGDVEGMRLNEGQEARLWTFNAVLQEKIVPGDAYALLLFDRAGALGRDLAQHLDASPT